MSLPTPPTRSLLACVAHPDDEAFTMGGTLALYARQGVRVYVLCGTRGEAGEIAPALLKGYGSAAELREAEVRCAARVLGLIDVFFLGYRDSGMPGSPDLNHPNAMAAQPVDEVAAGVARYIRMVKPQVVITHDPIGGYKHPDHIALQRATLRAFELAPDPNFNSDLPPYQPAKLYYQTMSKRMLRWAVRLAPLFGMDPHHFGRNRDIDLASLVVEGDFPIHARIDCRSVREVSAKASACHASQGGADSGRRSPRAFLVRWLGTSETFMRAIPAPEAGLKETDLFEGIA